MANFIIQNKTFWNVLMVCHKYSIPSDVSKIIYDWLLHKSSQNIIDKWYSYVKIHNTNLVTLVVNLKKNFYYSPITGGYFFYDVKDINVYTTFKICIKYIKPIISSKNWWIEHIQYLLNGFYIYDKTYYDYYYNPIVYPLLEFLHKLN